VEIFFNRIKHIINTFSFNQKDTLKMIKVNKDVSLALMPPIKTGDKLK
jgi:polysaccharide deacetylase 2 family uncharacterized protein YibQ